MRLARPRLRALGLAAALWVGALSGGCDAMMKPQEKKEDEKTRLAHFEENAQTYYDGGKYEDAVVQWRKVLEIEPRRQKARWGLAKSLAMIDNPQSLRQAEEMYDELLKESFVHPTRGDIKFEVERDAAQVYVDLADWIEKAMRANEARMAAGKGDPRLPEIVAKQRAAHDEYLRKAIPLFEQVLSESKDNPYALAGLAKANLMMGDEDQGIAYGHRYVEISVQSVAGWKRELDDIVKQNGVATDDEKRIFFQRIHGAEEKEVGMRLLIASVLMRKRRYPEASDEYTRVLEIDPARPAAYAERAQAYALSGEYRKAVMDLEEFLKITDPVKQREARINAAQLLETYRKILAGVTVKPPPLPASPPPPPPATPQAPR